MLESGQGYWQLAVREEKGIRNKSNSLSSLISEAVYLQVFSTTFLLLFDKFTVQGRDLLNGGSERVLQSLELPRSGNGTHAFCQGNFFSHQISGHAGKRAIDRSRDKYSGEEIATSLCYSLG